MYNIDSSRTMKDTVVVYVARKPAQLSMEMSSVCDTHKSGRLLDHHYVCIQHLVKNDS